MNFETALAFVLPSEADAGDAGSIAVDRMGPRVTDDPSDKGGRTNDGVTQEDYDDFRLRNGLAPRAVDFLTVSERNAIYRADDWDSNRCGLLPDPLALALFDYSVHSGRTRAAKALQGILGVAADGRIGKITLAAVAETRVGVRVGAGPAAAGLSGGAALAWKLIDERNGLFASIVARDRSQSKFLRGWFRRTAALALACSRL